MIHFKKTILKHKIKLLLTLSIIQLTNVIGQNIELDTMFVKSSVGQSAKQDITIKQHIDKIRTVFESYIKYQESTDSPDNKDLMTKSLNSLTVLTNKDELELLINVWMYYDPTDFPSRSLVYRVLRDNKQRSIEAVKNRIKNKKEWENEEIAPFSELKNLLQRLENE